jgi:ABC-type enterobactin transport system permease subunit
MIAPEVMWIMLSANVVRILHPRLRDLPLGEQRGAHIGVSVNGMRMLPIYCIHQYVCI